MPVVIDVDQSVCPISFFADRLRLAGDGEEMTSTPTHDGDVVFPANGLDLRPGGGQAAGVALMLV